MELSGKTLSQKTTCAANRLSVSWELELVRLECQEDVVCRCIDEHLALAQEAVAAKADLALSEEERVFMYMPYMHSESRSIHEVAERLFKEGGPKSNYEFELRHKAIIDRFGRYPHRNAMVGRQSTEEELAFLAQPGSSF